MERRRANPNEPLSELLSGWGVALDEDQFVALLRETLDQVADRDLRADPVDELPAEELALLRDGGFSTDRPPVGGDDPLLRGAVDLSALVATALSTREAATLLRVDPSRIRQRLTGAGPSLYGIKWHGEWLLPRFQFAGAAAGSDAGELPGLDRVLPHLAPGLSPVAVARWFLSPSPDLVASEDGEPMSPRAWLLAGHPPAEVARLAEAL